jgi:hypothetical protein
MEGRANNDPGGKNLEKTIRIDFHMNLTRFSLDETGDDRRAKFYKAVVPHKLHALL